MFKIILIIAIILILTILLISAFLFLVTMCGFFKIPISALVEESILANLKDMEAELMSYPMEEVSITSFDGYRLVGHYIPVEDAKRTVILVHGWRSTWCVDFAHIAIWLHSVNCNLLMIEQRAQGSSGGKYITFGINEKKDILGWISYLKNNNMLYGLPLYLWGGSMGAATVLMDSALISPDDITAVIADSAYSSIYDEFAFVGGKMHLPVHPIIDIIWLLSRIFIHIDIKKDGSVTDAVSTARVPILFIHGEADDFVPCKLGLKNYEACTGEKQLELFPDAKHVQGFASDKPRYTDMILNYFESAEYF